MKLPFRQLRMLNSLSRLFLSIFLPKLETWYREKGLCDSITHMVLFDILESMLHLVGALHPWVVSVDVFWDVMVPPASSSFLVNTCCLILAQSSVTHFLVSKSHNGVTFNLNSKLFKKGPIVKWVALKNWKIKKKCFYLCLQSSLPVNSDLPHMVTLFYILFSALNVEAINILTSDTG